MGLYIHKDREGKLAVLEDLDTRALAFFVTTRLGLPGSRSATGNGIKGHHRARSGTITAARNRWCTRPFGNVVRRIETCVDPSMPYIPVGIGQLEF